MRLLRSVCMSWIVVDENSEELGSAPDANVCTGGGIYAAFSNYTATPYRSLP